MTDQHISDLGVEAQRLLENPAFLAIFDRMRDSVQHAWRNADLRDTEGQQLLLQQAKIIDRIQETALGMVQSGKLADSRIRESGLRTESLAKRVLRKVS
ncbi:MAG: hypothetical protein DI563_01955 [Variovorax paradoxus]|uniref:Uncharacterized protein n=1 Tax=Variovorax paradoxus TaxID=34073 RepID=A0A2W5QLV1_VARPD|nr:MAG: hypothetical protein DI563_01955 [Variovorax paradoxus]